ncbi:MAG: DUF2934 domain-containing protein [Candidatus Omnitrophica bacterium]|nr:DUF2934 domain-containing protein [Candidatus Omnitrophota bacterium]
MVTSKKKKIFQAAKKTVRQSAKQAVKQIAKKRPVSKKEELFNLTLEEISQAIKTRAYYIWEEIGRPEGKEVEIWDKAEKEMLRKIIKGK